MNLAPVTEQLKPHQFTSTKQPKRNGHPKGRTATEWLRVLSKTNIPFHNPITNKDEIGPVNLVVAIQLILKATQDSDLPSIKEYFERLDGKIPQTLLGQSAGDTKIVLVYPSDYKGKGRIDVTQNERTERIELGSTTTTGNEVTDGSKTESIPSGIPGLNS